MFQDTSALMETLEGTLTEVVAQLPTFFPWVSSLNAVDRHTFAVELLKTVQARDTAQLIELVEDWQATAEALTTHRFMQAWQRPEDPGEDIPWEEVRGELDPWREHKAGRP